MDEVSAKALGTLLTARNRNVSSPNPNHRASQLEKLPCELRDMIYGYMLTGNADEMHYTYSNFTASPVDLHTGKPTVQRMIPYIFTNSSSALCRLQDLFLINSHISPEIKLHFFKHATFHLSSSSSATDWADDLIAFVTLMGLTHTPLLRNIRIPFLWSVSRASPDLHPRLPAIPNRLPGLEAVTDFFPALRTLDLGIATSNWLPQHHPTPFNLDWHAAEYSRIYRQITRAPTLDKRPALCRLTRWDWPDDAAAPTHLIPAGFAAARRLAHVDVRVFAVDDVLESEWMARERWERFEAEWSVLSAGEQRAIRRLYWGRLVRMLGGWLGAKSVRSLEGELGVEAGEAGSRAAAGRDWFSPRGVQGRCMLMERPEMVQGVLNVYCKGFQYIKSEPSDL